MAVNMVHGQDGHLCGREPTPSTSKIGCRCHLKCFSALMFRRPRGGAAYTAMFRVFYVIRAEGGKNSERKAAVFVGDLVRALDSKPTMSHEELTDMIELLRRYHFEDLSSCLSIYDDEDWGFLFRGMYSNRSK